MRVAAVRTCVGSDDVIILAVAQTRKQLMCVGGDGILPIWYMEGTRTPLRDERCGTYVDVEQRYVMAPRK